MAPIEDDGVDPAGQVVAFPAASGREYWLAWVEHSHTRELREDGAVHTNDPHWLVYSVDGPLPIAVSPESLAGMQPTALRHDHVVLPESAQQWRTLTDADAGRVVAVPNLARGHEADDHRLGVVNTIGLEHAVGARYLAVSAINGSWSTVLNKDDAARVRVLPTTLSPSDIHALSTPASQHRQQVRGEQSEQAEQRRPAIVRSLALGL
jgi:hypothetical protein